jgi:hypothetical protein
MSISQFVKKNGVWRPGEFSPGREERETGFPEMRGFTPVRKIRAN